MSQPEGKRVKGLTDFGELERLPRDTRALLLSNMDDIRFLIEFGRSNRERRLFLKRQRVFPMWFKRQCGFPEDMSDEEANERILSFLSRLDKWGWLTWGSSASVRIAQNHWESWNIQVTVEPAYAEVLTKLQEYLPRIWATRSWSEPKIDSINGKLTIICYSDAVHPIFDMLHIVEFLNTRLSYPRLLFMVDETFSCVDPFDIMALIVFFNMYELLRYRPDGTHDHMSDYKRAKASYEKLRVYSSNIYQTLPSDLYGLVQSRLLEGKIKLSEL